MKRKIAIIIERAEVVLGGAERSIFELARELSKSGLEVDVLAAKGQTNAKNIHILCQEAAGKRVRYAAFGKVLKKYLAENHYDIVHSTLPFDFADIYQPRGGSYAEAIVQNAASYQNGFIEAYKRLTAFANWRRTALLRAERRLCQNPNGPVIAALSHYVAGQFKERYGLEQERIEVIPNGVRIDRPVHKAEAETLRTQIFSRLGLKEADRPVLLLFVANNFRLKGLRTLIKAMQLATGNNPSAKTYLIVAGRDKSHKYRSLAKRLQVENKILFLGTLRHIQNALSITDVAVLPSFYDPSSRFILEALAAGRAVITTKFNGAVDLFVNNRHGKVIDCPKDTGLLASAIRYFSDTDNIKKASEAIVTDKLKEKISVKRVVKQLGAVYDSILEKRRR